MFWNVFRGNDKFVRPEDRGQKLLIEGLHAADDFHDLARDL